MQPPVCAVCRAQPPAGAWRTHGFATYAFGDHRSDADRPPGWVGHPPGLLWLCPTDAGVTSDLRARPAAEAVRVARQRRGLDL